jgi:TRAP-type C4-dicarboxylate transport system permease small subunit
VVEIASPARAPSRTARAGRGRDAIAALALADRLLQRLTGLVVAAALLLMCTVIITIVIARYGFGIALFWGEELARYTMIYMALLGGAVALRTHQHPRLTIVVDMLPASARRIVGMVVNLLIALTLVVLVWNGIDIVLEEGVMRTPALRIRYFWVYLAIPVGAAVMLLQLVAMQFLPGVLDLSGGDPAETEKAE